MGVYSLTAITKPLRFRRRGDPEALRSCSFFHCSHRYYDLMRQS